ncbi:MAG: TonB-dependent receptor, partial [Bacteroidia bacterium]|nr:TonB-dependent receptor [Bacteroidia bacterium]
DIDGSPKWIFSEENNFRIPPNHRLDIGVEWRTSNEKGEPRMLNIGVYNVYNRQNPFYLSMIREFNDAAQQWEYNLIQQSLFPILPSISYTWQF